MSGLLRCQLDSYIKRLGTKVVSCERISKPIRSEFKAKLPKAASHVVELEDSVLFCEGGGQPSDQGTINDIPVLYVGRNSQGSVLHFTTGSLDPDTQVEVKLDWNRRFDHMQQHSGQHLISAIAEQKYGWETTSWWLGDTICNVEFKITKKDYPVNDANLDHLNEDINQIIRDNRSVTTRILEESGSDLSAVSPEQERKSNDRHHGAMRVVEIENVDQNPCCGTHVSHTSELQVVKLMGFEKARGNYRVFFHVGNRAIRALDEMYKREVQLRSLLSCGAEEHAGMIKKMQEDQKALLKSNKSLWGEVAEYQADKLIQESKTNPHRVVSMHRKEGDVGFLTAVVSHVLKESPESVCFFASGCMNEEGIFLLQSSEEDVIPWGKELAQIMNGRGGGKANRFQAKVKNLEKFEDAVTVLQNKLRK